jgi:hypothetical protein
MLFLTIARRTPLTSHWGLRKPGAWFTFLACCMMCNKSSTGVNRAVAELEARLESFSKASSSGREVLPLNQYHRQYICFTKQGKHYIYDSFYAVPGVFVAKYEGIQRYRLSACSIW